MSQTVPTLMFWRVVQALGSSSGMSVGAGAIGDIYRLEERGAAMGIFFGVSLCILSNFDDGRQDSSHSGPAGIAVRSSNCAVAWWLRHSLFLMATRAMGPFRDGPFCAPPCLALASGDARPREAANLGCHRGA